MLFVAIATAGYFGYVTYQKLKKKNDPALKELLEGVETIQSIALTELEQDLSALEHPITTITFFDGNHKDIVGQLEANVNKVLQNHPWMGGCLAWDKLDGGTVKIFFDETGQQRVTSGHFQLYGIEEEDDDDDGEEDSSDGGGNNNIRISRDKSLYKHYCAMCVTKDVSVKLNYELIGKPLPFWKLSVIPDADRPQERFAIVLSMSHAVGDAHTYYQLYRMLLSANDENDSMNTFNPYRIYDVKDKMIEKVGKQEATYLWSAISQPVVDMTQKNTLFTDKKTGVPKIFFNKEKKVHKLFVVSRDFIDLLRGEESFGRVEHDETSSSSTNSLLTSYFFKQNEASIGMMLVDLRQRLDEECPELTTSLAGNYTFPIIYTPQDYDKPDLIQKSLKTMKRCSGDGSSDGSGTNDEENEAMKPLPRFRWDMTPSISVNWCNNSLNEIQLGSSCQPVLHLPIWNDLVKTGPIDKVGKVVGNIKKKGSSDNCDEADVSEEAAAKSEIFPSRVSVLQLFTIEPTVNGTNKDGDKAKKKLGASVMCTESVWAKIESSGLVEKMIG